MTDATHPTISCYTSPEGQNYTEIDAGHGRCAIVVQKAPYREADDSGQDAAAIASWDNACALLVADGAGGHANGAWASRATIAAITRQLAESAAEGLAIQAAVMAGIEIANQELMDHRSNPVTTILAAIVADGELRTCHAGDSELLVVGQRGRIKHQTVSHTPVGYGIEAGLIDSDEQLHHDSRHLISSCVGMEGMRVEVTSGIRLARRDTVVLASDGLWDNLHVEEVIDIVRKGPLKTAAHRLVGKCVERMNGSDAEVAGKPDDLSIVLYRSR